MVYLEVAAVVTRGQHFKGLFKPNQPLIPRGQRLVALYDVSGAQRGIDVTDPRDYRIVFIVSRGGLLDPVRLYWMDEHYIEECRIPEIDDTRR